MKLNVAERISLLQILPSEGDFTTLRVLRELQGKLGFSEADWKKFKLERVEDRVQWDIKEGAKDVEIEMGEKALEIIKDALVKLDKSKKLTSQLISVYEKFVQDK